MNMGTCPPKKSLDWNKFTFKKKQIFVTQGYWSYIDVDQEYMLKSITCQPYGLEARI